MPHHIPKKELEKIRQRDKDCVYCHKLMTNPRDGGSRKNWATIEHLNHLQEWDSVRSFVREGKPVSEIIAICCWSCNASRSDKRLSDWFKMPYCINKNINEKTVTEVVRNYIHKYEK